MLIISRPDKGVSRMGNRIYVRGASKGALEQKDQGNVSPKWIGAIQRQVKIGDTINVKTNKCCSVDEGMSGKSGVWRKGTVIGIFRNFVHVRLQSGV